jgi:hypothetical protein
MWWSMRAEALLERPARVVVVLSTPLTTETRSAPTTEMYTRCRAPARDAA